MMGFGVVGDHVLRDSLRRASYAHAVFDISLVKASGFGCRRRKLAQREIEPFEAN
jgi:hypothetical protein